ncbi:AAA family ATPase [Mucilaginibacter gotjawali]|uniref:ATPase family associated with various cellular activities (AAA) n=2 Tax=Mucilaginibacter gotjawali TaxID=1550579 RepID=A0A0X8X241_9SPHI|nr:MoxR family ATPase [Mucilaginibacter gotjawali]MBB3057974.1 MoxR-like ATPase [Mucilaginibacter gotjawali]BAU52254.1 ATPase family associated with various cellular activities (AAA) [Mucilaginibacter gotjawali]
MQHRTEVEAADALRQAYQQISAEIGKVIIGQQEVLKFVLISIFSNGHCLLVGVPGLAKTLLVQTVAQVLDLDFKRIQFTPDLMPSDIIGSEILGEDRNFKFIPGPVFANIILADEINRTPPKTQAALLEAMMEKSVTAAGITHRLAQPFFVLATQNPIEQEGTYPLPEAQLDRFMFNVALDYPTFQEELLVVKNTTSSQKTEVKKLLSAEQIIYFQQLVRNIPVTDNVLEYAVKLVAKTRPNGEMAAPQVKRLLNWGAGPRASQFLILGAKCHAVINGKYSPDIEDVQAIAKPILRHRIVRSYHAEAEGLSADDIIEGLF